jgi:hypothetical protein
MARTAACAPEKIAVKSRSGTQKVYKKGERSKKAQELQNKLRRHPVPGNVEAVSRRMAVLEEMASMEEATRSLLLDRIIQQEWQDRHGGHDADLDPCGVGLEMLRVLVTSLTRECQGLRRKLHLASVFRTCV